MRTLANTNTLKKRTFLLDSIYNLSIPQKILLSFLLASFTGFCAQLRVKLPWTPVPVTGQTFAVLLSGILLGKLGGVSQSIYVALGLLGLPWFSGGRGGFSILLGSTGGYLLGFIFASTFVGYVYQSQRIFRKFIPLLALLTFSNFAFIYVPGLLQLYFWSKFVNAAPLDSITLLRLGLLPFVPGDLLKIFFVALSGSGLHSKAKTNLK